MTGTPEYIPEIYKKKCHIHSYTARAANARYVHTDKGVAGVRNKFSSYLDFKHV